VANASNRVQFEQCLLASGLVTEEQLEEARVTLNPLDPDGPSITGRELADQLIESGLLNAWQVQQLFEGRTRFTLGPYRIVDSIGQGGMGQVFKARHSLMERIVAVKVLPLAKSTPDAIDSFIHEIEALASLQHPRLVKALDAGYDGNVYYLVTEYVPGIDLRKMVRRDGPLSMYAAADIIFQVAEGLEYAHQAGFIHRDIKPANVLVTPENEAKLLDLGLAGPLEDAANKDPRFGKVCGTADYLSPEHIREPWTPMPAWDIYSLGCTLYYAVTGKVPFPGGSTPEKARAHCELRPLDPRRLNQQLSDAFVELMADMMAKDASERIGSAAEVMWQLSPWTKRPLPPEIEARLAASLPVLPPGEDNPSDPDAIEPQAAPPSIPTEHDRDSTARPRMHPLILFALLPAIAVTIAMSLWSLVKWLW